VVAVSFDNLSGEKFEMHNQGEKKNLTEILANLRRL